MGRQGEGTKGNGPQWLEQKAGEPEWTDPGKAPYGHLTSTLLFHAVVTDFQFLEWTGDENPSQLHEIGEWTLDDHKELCRGRLELNYWSQVLCESRKP
ncbi:hypothetical protein M514_18828 [Trichuris suis]|uniref:Uncharacterized protein n=1 Tax=Trichuris suis TaxID=68888 RepID=A0A085NHS9_9BILA|nr:hypothetical protein M513_06632 [Trichuris suis]KFD52439.1 hypothetical protein M513_06636 [Trichuris suis]KFD69024.1 hypothetical protein M514_18827 [Trichuris suis]KFD69025.1 hypothetical protein M514_18828 [Trichuris suis]